MVCLARGVAFTFHCTTCGSISVQPVIALSQLISLLSPPDVLHTEPRMAQVAALFDDNGIQIRFMHSSLAGDGICDVASANDLVNRACPPCPCLRKAVLAVGRST